MEYMIALWFFSLVGLFKERSVRGFLFRVFVLLLTVVSCRLVLGWSCAEIPGIWFVAALCAALGLRCHPDLDRLDVEKASAMRPTELRLTPKQFREHLNRSCAIVRKWPRWKRDVVIPRGKPGPRQHGGFATVPRRSRPKRGV